MGPMVCGTPAFTATLEVQTRNPGADSCTRRMPESISTFAGVTPAGLPSTSICAPAGTELTLITPKFGLSATLSFCFSPPPAMFSALDVIEVTRRLEGERAIAGGHVDDAGHPPDARAVGGDLRGDAAACRLRACRVV